MKTQVYNPACTYRIQFHHQFTLSDFEKYRDYFRKLGVHTIYASPVFKTAPGSNHGYDVANPLVINDEIGSQEQLKKIITALKQDDIGWLQDIVPNHMAFHIDNCWLKDVLENGKESAFASYFDIDWTEKLMVPFGDEELKIVKENNSFFLTSYDNKFPLSQQSQEYLKMHENELGNEDVIKKILDEQVYRLCNWKETSKKINYRRFFTVNGLICLNMQDKKVFDHYHQLIAEFTRANLFRGLRIDHIDGLYNPGLYIQWLNELTGNQLYIVAEKILQAGETIQREWNIEGNTGYDFLALVNNLFTNKKAEEKFTQYYQQLTGISNDPYAQLLEKKTMILYDHMRGELDNLYRLFLKTVDKRLLSTVPSSDIKRAIGEFLIYCPVYRYYNNDEQAKGIESILSQLEQCEDINNAAVSLLRRSMHPDFIKRCMQFTGPLMAKGLEDTFMYTYNRFIAHNDVGDSPLMFGITADEFHNAMIERQKHWPLSLNTTSTHDTKRGEDARARLNVLTDIPDEWFEKLKEWQQNNKTIRPESIPDGNEEYFIYQSIIGGYPMPGQDKGQFIERLKEYLQKALREGKTNTDWGNPNEAYEGAVQKFAADLFSKNHSFLNSFEDFHIRIADFGIVNSLSQLLLKFTCPGIPDVYQGTELWDFSFVDPDNRRAVDYTHRVQLLETINNEMLWPNRYNGQIKLWLTHVLLKLRKQLGEFFHKADYIPLKAKGEFAEYVFAFARKYQEQWLVIAVPLHIAELCGKQQVNDVLKIDWKDTEIVLPKRLKKGFEDLLLRGEVEPQKKLLISGLFASMPFALLKAGSEENSRSAGILLHIASLPSQYGIGDFGPEAYRFADMLNRCNQKLWQVLPLNPVDGSQGYSPYSTSSTFAMNTLLISPEWLSKNDLLAEEQAESFKRTPGNKINYDEVVDIKNQIMDKAWDRFDKNKQHVLWNDFNNYCTTESKWLNDFALYSLIKKQQENKPWFEWPDKLKKKETSALDNLLKQYVNELNKIKFFQFIAAKQWQELKNYCNEKGIKILGDLSFYVSYDSADVWSHPHIFNISEEGKLNGVAGTPPDAFSDDGQRWGMPVYKWDVLKECNYEWWIDRIKRNRAIFDLVRLDHFRAFSAYWEIPGDSDSAKNGKWVPGPGAGFFDAVKHELGELPFVAEDLGEIDDAVIDLRDQFNLPGMKVLHFAFENGMPESEHIPHNHNLNFIVYTGTHDNNTTRGWYKQNNEVCNKINQYCAKPLTEESVAQELIRLAYSSVARAVVIPVQDLLNLDENARMNDPAKGNNNWSWRLQYDQLSADAENKLKEWVWVYCRD